MRPSADRATFELGAGALRPSIRLTVIADAGRSPDRALRRPGCIEPRLKRSGEPRKTVTQPRGEAHRVAREGVRRAPDAASSNDQLSDLPRAPAYSWTV
jgi:hypothetical protein